MLQREMGIHTSAILSLGLFAALCTQTAGADNDREIRMRFAGNFIQNLEQMEVGPLAQSIQSSTVGVIRGKARGNLGSGDLTVVTKAEPVLSPAPDERCPPNFVKIFDVKANNLLFTFEDLSLLYGDADDGAVCVNFLNGEQFVAIEGRWLGGTGRFRDATGQFSVHVDEFVPVSAATQVVAEAGTITGTLNQGE